MTSKIPVSDNSGFLDDFNKIQNHFAKLNERDFLFSQGIQYLIDIKVVRGGQALYSTLRKRKVLKNFLENYLSEVMSVKLDDLEESIANL